MLYVLSFNKIVIYYELISDLITKWHKNSVYLD